MAKASEKPLPPKPAYKRWVRRLRYGGMGSIALVATLTFGGNLFSLQERMCSAPLMQPSLSDLCGLWGVGNRPTTEERIAWESRTPGSCEALRTHRTRFPNGVFLREASERLAAKRVTGQEVWTPVTRRMKLVSQADLRSYNSEEAARASALLLGQERANFICKQHSPNDLTRVESFDLDDTKWDCTKFATGYACTIEAEVKCSVNRRDVLEVESCEG